MSRPISKPLYWDKNFVPNPTIDGHDTVLVLYAHGVVQRYATLKYIPYLGPKGTWTLKLRDWYKFENVEEAQVCAPPKEYVENLVLLAYDIKDYNA